MIRSVRLVRFKCFDDERIRCEPLTLLAGINGAGKSSLIQALLLVEQAQRGRGLALLNGPHELGLGQALDVLNQQKGGTTFVVSIDWNTDGEAEYTFDATNSESRSIPVSINDPEKFLGQMVPLTYLCADRAGPSDISPMDSGPEGILEVGTRGEYTAQVLALRDREKVREALQHPLTQAQGGLVTLGKQAELWMQDLVPGIQFRAETFAGTNAAALRLRRRDSTDEFLRPTNMAFGVTSALPVIVGGLLAPVGSLLIVDSPESHLHPSAQSKMGRFLAVVAASGVQVIVETHSDHILNGVRLAAIDGPIIPPNNVAVQFFSGDLSRATRAECIEVLPSGGLSRWPEGFFDQSEKDLARLARARRRG